MVSVKVELDRSVRSNKFFQKPTTIRLSKPSIFKYGIYREEVPEHIQEHDFEYLEGKVPHLVGLNSDWIELRQGAIINLASSEKATEISEIIGVGAGLYYATKLLISNPNRIERIPHPKHKGKILDFAIHKNKIRYEIETKGTAYRRQIKSMKADIKAKKNANKTPSVKIGTIALARKQGDKDASKLIVMDDFDEARIEGGSVLLTCLQNYMTILSLIVDSTHYNRLRRRLSSKRRRYRIPKEKIPNLFLHRGRKYLGQYFDRRLLLETITEQLDRSNGLNQLFRNLTKQVGREKYFLGLDEVVIDLLNRDAERDLSAYDLTSQLDEESDHFIYRDSDGVLLVKSRDRSLSQVEERFSEADVRKRLRFEFDYVRRRPHECGAPCRSRELEGKPCEKLTYREHCHFHR